MPCTIRQLLADRTLGLTLLTPGADVSRHVTWAHTSELVDPTPWLMGGELLMTLGIGLPPDAVGQAEYVARLTEAGVAALAVDTGIVLSQVPDAIVAAGDHGGLPILRVPQPTPFLAISHAVIAAANADSVAAAAEVSRRQDRVAAAAVKSGPAGVVRTLAPLLGCDVVLMTTAGVIVESQGPGATAVAARVIERFAPHDGPRPPLTFTHVDDQAVVTGCSVIDEVDGATILAIGSPAALTSQERLVVSHAATVLSLLLRTPERARDAEVRLRRAVGQAILAGSVSADPELIELLGLHPEELHVIADIRVATAHAEAGALIERLLQARRTAYLFARTGSGFTLALPAPGATELLLQLRRAVASHVSRDVVVGLSEPVGLAQLGDGLIQAAAAARASATQRVELTAYGELGPLDLFLRSQTADTLRAMAASLLQPLDEHDIVHGTDLVSTVSAYLERNGQAETTARQLGIHRHTLRQRLERVRLLLGRDLDDARVRTDLWVALQARAHLSDTRPTAPMPPARGAG